MMRRLLALGPDHEPMWVPLYVYPVGDQWHSVIVTDGVPPPGRERVCGERRPMMPLFHPLTQVANAALTTLIPSK